MLVSLWMNKGLFYRCIFFLGLLFLSGCAERSSLAPVVESHWRKPNYTASYHVVSKGETLYSIAFRYDQDYRRLAAINHLDRSYTVRVGQVIQLRFPRSPVTAPVSKAPVSRWSSLHFMQPRIRGWVMPAQGRIVAGFSPAQGRKGIDIAGQKGGKVHAAMSGVVAYSGNGISGYGHLIIIKHANQYLTAYGNNARSFVREGQLVTAGQNIAEMGLVDHRYWGMHFEIRHAGQPVNPANFIK